MKERLLALTTGPVRLRVLFSRHEEWEPMIRAGLAGTRHLIAFGDLALQDLWAYDVIVPLSVDAVLFLGASGRAALSSLLPVPSMECTRLFDDKYLFNQRLIDLGFGDHVPQMLTAPQPPFIVKPRIGVNSEDCHLVCDEEALERAAELVGNPRYFCQALVRGASEYATHIVFRDGRIVAELTIEYVAIGELFIKGKSKFVTTTICACPFPDLFTSMLTRLGFQGLCCINFKVVEGRPMLFEINPRFGYSLGPYFFTFLHRLVRHDDR